MDSATILKIESKWNKNSSRLETMMIGHSLGHYIIVNMLLFSE